MRAQPRCTLAVAIVASLLAACAPTDRRVVLNELRAQLSDQFHECVPLGWSVAPEHRMAVPAASVEVNEYGNGRVWLPAMWLARVSPRSRARADVRVVEQVLNALTRAKLLNRNDGPWANVYQLTHAALPYYLAENRRGDDPDALSYLCDSAIVPDAVLWTEPVHAAGPAGEPYFRTGFTWHASPRAPWADDPVIRAHSVVLTPASSPAVATLVRRDGAWTVIRLESEAGAMPLVVDAAAWPRARL